MTDNKITKTDYISKSERKLYKSTNRIEALTDGVFAIAMTLLVLSIEIPEARINGSDHVVLRMILTQIDLFYNYFLSFILLAMFWVTHHNQFQYLERTDSFQLWTNILLLMFVALVPFSTSLIGDYPQYGVADIFFAANIIIISLLNFLSVWHANKQGYLSEELPYGALKLAKKRTMLVLFTCTLAIFVALVYPLLSSFSFLLIPGLLWLPYFRQ